MPSLAKVALAIGILLVLAKRACTRILAGTRPPRPDVPRAPSSTSGYEGDQTPRWADAERRKLLGEIATAQRLQARRDANWRLACGLALSIIGVLALAWLLPQRPTTGAVVRTTDRAGLQRLEVSASGDRGTFNTLVQASRVQLEPRPVESTAGQRFTIRLPVALSDCRRALSLLGGRCGQSRARDKIAEASLELDLGHPFPVSVSASRTAILEPQASRRWTLHSGGAAVTLALECVGRPARMSVNVDGQTGDVRLCPARRGVLLTFVASVAPQGPGLLTFSDVRRIDGRYAPASVDLMAETVDYNVGGASGTYADDAALATRVTAAGESQLAVAFTTSGRDLDLSIRGEVSKLTVGGAQRLMTRYARDEEVWLALIGLGVSLFAPVVVEWLRTRRD